MKKRILEYLANGVKPVDVANIVGCTPAYVSQLLHDDDFKAELGERLEKQPEDASEIRLDTRYEAIEHKLLSQMESAMLEAELPAITQALRVITERQEKVRARKNPIFAPPTNVTYVSLTLPAHHSRQAPAIQMNERGEVLSIGENILAPMSVDGVKSMFQRMKGPIDETTTFLAPASQSSEGTARAETA